MGNLIEKADEVVIQIPSTFEGREFSSNLFYSEFLDLISNYCASFRKLFDKKLVLDFSNVKQIDPLVLPNLLNVGIGLNKLHLAITEIRNVSGEAACFMSKTNFKILAESEGIFRFENFDLVDFDEWDSKRQGARVYLNYIKYPEHLAKYRESDFEKYENIQQKLIEYIADEVHEDKAVIAELLRKYDGEELNIKMCFEQMEGELAGALAPEDKERKIYTAAIFKCILENVKNALIHGGKGCVIFLYAIPIKRLGKDKIFISVSDIGIGITKSIEQKPIKDLLFDEKAIKAFKNRRDLSVEEKRKYTHNYRCLLESIFYRARLHGGTHKYKVYGLFDVINSILSDKNAKTKNDVRVYMHSDEVRLCLTSNFYNQYLFPCIERKDGDLNIHEVVKTLSNEVYSFKDNFSYLKTCKRFGGTHIEYEFFDD